MVCEHLRELYRLCQDQHLRLGGADLIRVVCMQCGQQDVCPAVLMDEYDEATPGPAPLVTLDEGVAPPSPETSPR